MQYQMTAHLNRANVLSHLNRNPNPNPLNLTLRWCESALAPMLTISCVTVYSKSQHPL